MSISVPSRFLSKILPIAALLPMAGMVDSRAQTADSAGASTVWEHSGWGGGGFFYCAAIIQPRMGSSTWAGCRRGLQDEDHGLHWRTINNGLASYGVVFRSPSIAAIPIPFTPPRRVGFARAPMQARPG